jgi:hypothetical protein
MCVSACLLDRHRRRLYYLDRMKHAHIILKHLMLISTYVKIEALVFECGMVVFERVASSLS